MSIPVGQVRWQGAVHSSSVYSSMIRSVALVRLMMSLGQARTQAPQATHFSGSKIGRWSSPIFTASKSQTFTQVPRPRQPMGQTLLPP